jgi:hypothetical protein
MSTTMEERPAKSPSAPALPVSTAGDADGCAPSCDIPAFCRNTYYRGKLLTEREFADEQRMLADRRRLHHVALHGWGVACGLEVKPHPYCPELKLVIGEGLAIDCCGREIRLMREATIDLPRPPADTGARKAPATPNANAASAPGDPVAPPAGDGCEPPLPARSLYLCLSYAECDTEFTPAPFDDCGCNSGTSMKPNRICDSWRLDLYDTKPDFWDEAVGDECEAEDCHVYYRQGQHCHAPHGPCCVPLAMIVDVVPGQKVTPEQIRTRHNRRLLASTEAIDRVVRCILNKLPSEKLTRIDDTNWEHDQRYICRDFMSDFIGTPDHQRGFRVAFNQKVNSASLTPRTFQAMVVFHSDDPAAPCQMEIAPAQIQRDDGETEWCRLSIDPTYARNRLDMKDFDLFLTLRCDDVTDLRGLAVDGDFIAHRFPTGDNIQGGTFESWIRVRPRVIPA